jgi:hypothetical protein
LQERNKDKKIEYLWNNIIKLGKNNEKGFPQNWYDYDIIKQNFNEIILKEITILKPDFIVFFTGPNDPYDKVLNDIFNNPVRISVEGFSERELCGLKIKNVKKAFRTYHPTYLLRNNRKRPYEEYIEKIINEISSNM